MTESKEYLEIEQKLLADIEAECMERLAIAKQKTGLELCEQHAPEGDDAITDIGHIAEYGIDAIEEYFEKELEKAKIHIPQGVTVLKKVADIISAIGAAY
jgi:hypothetical protein